MPHQPQKSQSLQAWTWQERHNAFMAILADESPIAFLVNQEMGRGKKCAAAIDFICGEGSFKRLAKEIYDRCRSLGAKPCEPPVIKWVRDKPWFFASCPNCGAKSPIFLASHGAAESEAIAAIKCGCCDDKGYVQDALGQRRPCSRCNIDEYHEWARNRIDKAEAPHA